MAWGLSLHLLRKGSPYDEKHSRFGDASAVHGSFSSTCRATFNLSEIGKECGISLATAKDWLTALQATSIIHLLLEPFYRNVTKRVIKSRQLYFVDTGLLCYLLRIKTAEQLTFFSFSGHIFENMVVMDRIKGVAENGECPPCYFYRTSNGIEIDLLIDHGFFLDVYEIKFTASPHKKMASSLKSLKKDLPIKKAELLNLRSDPVPLGNEIVAKHWNDAEKICGVL